MTFEALLALLSEPVNWLIIAVAVALLELIVGVEITYFGAALGALVTAGVVAVLDPEVATPGVALVIFAAASLLSVVAVRYTLAPPSTAKKFRRDINSDPYKGDHTHMDMDQGDS